MPDCYTAPKSTYPNWIIFKGGRYEARIPFEDIPYHSAWQYVLDITAAGCKAVRIGDAIVVTGRPTSDENVGGVLS